MPAPSGPHDTIPAESALGTPLIAVVIVNWNGWQDVIECLESVFNSSERRFRVIVCDNASSDNSVTHILEWAKGERPAVAAVDTMAAFSTPAVRKPLRTIHVANGSLPDADAADLFVVETGGNLGFSGGNNVGLRIAANWPECQYFWLLNPDTVIAPDTMARMLDRLEAPDRPGMVGSEVIFYHTPDRYQAVNGAVFNKWTGTSHSIMEGSPVGTALDPAAIERQTDFVTGASLALSRAFLDRVGLLGEDYFLYYEEIDLATRNHGQLPTGFAQGARVYHKEGGAIGSSSRKGARSMNSERYLLESKLIFTRKHYPYALPAIYIYTMLQIIVRLGRGHWAKARLLARTLGGPSKRV